MCGSLFFRELIELLKTLQQLFYSELCRAVLSGVVVLSSLGALIEDIFTISEEMAFTVGFSISLVPIFIGLYLIFGFALMIARAVSKKRE
jgi:hypothetical protein